MPDRVIEPKPGTSGGASVDQALWARVGARAQGNPSVKAVIDQLSLVSAEGSLVRLRPMDGSSASSARARKAQLEELLSAEAGRSVRVEFDPPASGASRAMPAGVVDAALHAEASRNPLVRRAMELFDARVIDVRPEDPGAGASGASLDALPGPEAGLSDEGPPGHSEG